MSGISDLKIGVIHKAGYTAGNNYWKFTIGAKSKGSRVIPGYGAVKTVKTDISRYIGTHVDEETVEYAPELGMPDVSNFDVMGTARDPHRQNVFHNNTELKMTCTLIGVRGVKPTAN